MDRVPLEMVHRFRHDSVPIDSLITGSLSMRLATVQTRSGPRVALLAGNDYIDLHASDSTLPESMIPLLEAGPDALAAARKAADRSDAVRYPAAQVTLCPPVPNPRKVICLGRNYKGHAAESGSPPPREPILFSKYATALIGQEQPIVLPAVSQEIDYEAELVVVIGKRGRPRNVDEARAFVFGYTIGNDVSARDWQTKKDGKQWMVGKTFDTFAPLGPYLVTADEVPEAHSLSIRLRLNGQTMQDANTRDMIFRIEDVIAYLGLVFTLEPGDLIFMGTPPGVGFARKPPVFLKSGDLVEIEIERLGLLRNPVR
jgi:2-keto-4-pentenoate hydratase/2-oxohepta-3-ene-1,7-dioic acid hydratase in catechol pathway